MNDLPLSQIELRLGGHENDHQGPRSPVRNARLGFYTIEIAKADLVFALDRMEPMRPVVDRAVLQIVRDTTFTGADFLLQPDGVCRLNPELARRVAQLATDHSYEVVEDHS